MTPATQEPRHRRVAQRRIAAGSGTRVQDVNALIKQFEQTRKMLKQLGDASRRKGPIGKMPFMP